MEVVVEGEDVHIGGVCVRERNRERNYVHLCMLV